jgi:hypothetical protein
LYVRGVFEKTPYLSSLGNHGHRERVSVGVAATGWRSQDLNIGIMNKIK